LRYKGLHYTVRAADVGCVLGKRIFGGGCAGSLSFFHVSEQRAQISIRFGVAR
jgi:hypothetical protein